MSFLTKLALRYFSKRFSQPLNFIGRCISQTNVNAIFVSQAFDYVIHWECDAGGNA